MAFINGTGVNQPSALLVNTLDSISQKLIYPKMADLVFNPSPTFSYLNQYAKKYNAGAEIVYPLITSKITTRGAYWGDQLLSTAAIDAVQPADQVWRGYYESISLPIMDIVIGRGGPVGLRLRPARHIRDRDRACRRAVRDTCGSSPPTGTPGRPKSRSAPPSVPAAPSA